MKILEHSESHIVKLDDGSTWQIFPGHIDYTLSWMPTTELRLFEVNDDVASHALINSDDGTHVRVRPQGERWPAAKVRHILSADADQWALSFSQFPNGQVNHRTE